MRKTAAIAFLFMLAFSQYARQALYLECRIMNNFRPGTEQCDCDKINAPEKADPPSPLSKSHTHIHIDELFSSVQASQITRPLIQEDPLTYHHYVQSLPDGIYPDRFRPPGFCI